MNRNLNGIDRRSWMVLALAAPAWAQRPDTSDEDDVIRIDVELVNLFFSVRDRSNALVPNLTKEDFEVFEDGVLQPIDRLVAETNLPLTIGLLIDVSLSQERLIPAEQDAGAQFFEQVLRQKDIGFLLSFGPYVEMLQDLTGSAKLLREGLKGLKAISPAVAPMTQPGPVPGQQVAGTVLFDSVYLASEDVLKKEVGRKTIILISDGIDTGSKVSKDKAIQAAHNADAIIYGIEYYDPGQYGVFGGGGGGTLGVLARETGGRRFSLDRNGLKRIFDEIQAELRSQYYLAYKPLNTKKDGGFRKIEIRPKKKGLKVQARRGYYASAS
jgi:VWFA-related protein